MADAVEILRYTLGPFQQNAYLLVGPSGRRVAVIDPGFDARVLLDEVRARDLEVEIILNTHGHLDHAAGNRLVKDATGAPLAIHPLDEPYLARLAAQAAMFGLEADDSPRPDVSLVEGTPVRFDGLALEVIHTPGHTPGGVCLRLDRNLWVGDTLFRGSVGRTDLPGGSWPDLLRSIREKLFRLPGDLVCLPGHGEETTLAEERKTNPFVSDAVVGTAPPSLP